MALLDEMKKEPRGSAKRTNRLANNNNNQKKGASKQQQGQSSSKKKRNRESTCEGPSTVSRLGLGG
jgi:hypothetical protein